jgi:cellulose biosynthesis protein BcsQ
MLVAKVISVFNNKGGVGKSTISWNLAHSLGCQGKRTLLVDFDPQCNLSIAMLGEQQFNEQMPTQTQGGVKLQVHQQEQALLGLSCSAANTLRPVSSIPASCVDAC